MANTFTSNQKMTPEVMDWASQFKGQTIKITVTDSGFIRLWTREPNDQLAKKEEQLRVAVESINTVLKYLDNAIAADDSHSADELGCAEIALNNALQQIAAMDGVANNG